mmetsp:Transcript_105219/g.322536  ORF Transcript_105219/g.322536 Transcript_105219/m.322536 type:complete len:210 (+) Transcript_105219:196-825(+)
MFIVLAPDLVLGLQPRDPRQHHVGRIRDHARDRACYGAPDEGLQGQGHAVLDQLEPILKQLVQRALQGAEGDPANANQDPSSLQGLDDLVGRGLEEHLPYGLLFVLRLACLQLPVEDLEGRADPGTRQVPQDPRRDHHRQLQVRVAGVDERQQAELASEQVEASHVQAHVGRLPEEVEGQPVQQADGALWRQQREAGLDARLQRIQWVA